MVGHTPLNLDNVAISLRMKQVDTVFCQAPEIPHPHRCGDFELSRAVKTTASAREPASGGAARSIFLGLACGLDSPCFREPVPHRREPNEWLSCHRQRERLGMTGLPRLEGLPFGHHRPGQMYQLAGGRTARHFHRLASCP